MNQLGKINAFFNEIKSNLGFSQTKLKARKAKTVKVSGKIKAKKTKAVKAKAITSKRKSLRKK